jgi:hypothetical protein
MLSGYQFPRVRPDPVFHSSADQEPEDVRGQTRNVDGVSKQPESFLERDVAGIGTVLLSFAGCADGQSGDNPPDLAPMPFAEDYALLLHNEIGSGESNLSRQLSAPGLLTMCDKYPG